MLLFPGLSSWSKRKDVLWGPVTRVHCLAFSLPSPETHNLTSKHLGILPAEMYGVLWVGT